MDLGEAPGNQNLDRLNDLCADLGATVGNGQLLAWANACDAAAVPDVVFGVVSTVGLLADGGLPNGNPALRPRRRQIADVPADADALWSRMWEVDEPTAIELLTNLAVSAQPSRSRRGRLLPSHQHQAQDVFQEMAHLTGPGTRWWTNTDLTSWNPITQHTFDAVVVAAGNDIVVTLISFEGGG